MIVMIITVLGTESLRIRWGTKAIEQLDDFQGGVVREGSIPDYATSISRALSLLADDSLVALDFNTIRQYCIARSGIVRGENITGTIRLVTLHGYKLIVAMGACG